MSNLYNLVINTLGKNPCIGLFNNNVCVDRKELTQNNSKAESILTTIKELLIKQDITKDSLHFISYISGPGSLTSVRVVASITLGLSRSIDCKVISLSKFDILKSNTSLKSCTLLVVDLGREKLAVQVIDNSLENNQDFEVINLQDLHSYASKNRSEIVVIDHNLKDSITYLPKREVLFLDASDNVLKHSNRISLDKYENKSNTKVLPKFPRFS